ncbi:metal-dependent hydrolase [Glaciibacter superstes]|uniref:metal-dependent hydrolase n=1 Tax=Glaciibacter superstes TaxID=501023 RepID=UPI0003B41F31|nr:metal-dependent hydrolase [Glaciibacter superstes]
MTLPRQSTRVDYPAGIVRNSATVLHVEGLPNGTMVVLLDRTSVHPIDAGWPDQSADRATLIPAGSTAGGHHIEITDCIVGATDGAALYLGRDIPVAKGTDGWGFVVVHVVAGDAALAEGDRVDVEVDAGFRERTSTGHTACHLASLALNEALAGRWRKEIRADGLGHPDFDGAANDVSLITENGSTDTYRLGKSLRKKGFVAEGFADGLDEVEQTANAALAEWVATDAAVRVERDGETLTDRRYWVCELPGAEVRIPCGGTHRNSLAGLGSVRIALSTEDVDGTTILTMETTATTATSTTTATTVPSAG